MSGATCLTCNGIGRVVHRHPSRRVHYIPCRTCNGTGMAAAKGGMR